MGQRMKTTNHGAPGGGGGVGGRRKKKKIRCVVPENTGTSREGRGKPEKKSVFLALFLKTQETVWKIGEFQEAEEELGTPDRRSGTDKGEQHKLCAKDVSIL